MPKMGFAFGLGDPNTCFKRKFRWLLKIPQVSAEGIDSLPPLKSARPSISFKEMEVQHLTEQVFFPSKPEWKPITVSLYDLKRAKHPVYEWVRKVYRPNADDNNWSPSVGNGFKIQARLELYDGCGDTLESWVYENAWPQDVNFGELDMGSSEYVTCDIVLRYDRAYLDPGSSHSASSF